MKKILLLLLTLIFFNCTNPNSTKNELISLGLKGKVKSLIEFSYPKLSKKWDNKDFEYLFDEKGFFKKKINYSNSSYTVFVYDNSSKVVEIKMYSKSNDKLVYTFVFEYNNEGDALNLKSIDSTNVTTRTRNYKYSTNNKGNKVIIEMESTSNGKLIEHFEKTMNKDDKEIFRETFDNKNNKVTFNNTKYDDNGNMIYRDKLDSLNNLNWNMKIKYNNNDLEIERVLYNPSIDRKSIFKFEYILDDKLNWIKKFRILKNDTIQTKERIIEYY